MLDLWLVRHAESLGNIDGTHADTDLSPAGQEQARQLGRALSGVDFDVVWSSPLLRARQTAALALPGKAHVVDERLKELEASSLPHFVDTSNAAELQAFLARPASQPAESEKAFMARVEQWRRSLPPEGRVIVFTHVGVVRELLAGYLGFRRAPQEMAHTGVFRLGIGAGVLDVLAWNEHTHIIVAGA
jgi:broad specificity phosphatase PhoE